MKVPKQLTGIQEFFKKKKSLEIVLAIVIIAVIISIYVSTLAPAKTSDNTPAQDDINAQYIQTEQRLMEVLSQIKGAGKVEVMITYESGPEIITALNTDQQVTTSQGGDQQSESTSQSQSQSPATKQQQSGTEPIILKENQPKVRGVIVIAKGAADVRVKMDLIRATRTVLNVPAENIDVFEMKNE